MGQETEQNRDLDLKPITTTTNLIQHYLCDKKQSRTETIGQDSNHLKVLDHQKVWEVPLTVLEDSCSQFLGRTLVR